MPLLKTDTVTIMTLYLVEYDCVIWQILDGCVAC